MTNKQDLHGLLRGLDIIARDLGRIDPVDIVLPIVGAATLIFWITSIILLDLTNPYIDALTLASGFTGFTTLFVDGLLIMHRLNKHIDYSSYYYSQVNDILERLGIHGSLEEYIEGLALLRTPRLEYFPIVLVAGYLGLLLQYIYYYSLILAFIYSLIIGLYLYSGFNAFNKHLVSEKALDSRVAELLGISEYREKTDVSVNPVVCLLISSITFSIGLLYYTFLNNNIIDIHTSEHRHFHNRILKPSVMRAIRKMEEA